MYSMNSPQLAKGEDKPERVSGDADRGDGNDTRGRQPECSGVADGPRPGGGQEHRTEELDRAHRRQRQPVHRQVERRVHHGEHDAEGQQRTAAVLARDPRPPEQPPRAPPDAKRHGGTCDAQPGHPEHVQTGEQQHG
jgi:hypothetical protein